MNASPRFTTEFSQSVVIEGEHTRDVPLLRVRGIVVDSDGLPIAEATIVRAGEGNDDSAGALSAPGEQHLRANTRVTTSKKGEFTVHVPSDRAETFVVEADGYALKLFHASALTDGSDRVVVLERGASLRVRWQTSGHERAERISLLPVDVALPAGLGRRDAIRMWTRPMNGSEQRWVSLPSGTWRIVIRAADAADGNVPLDAGDVILAPGDDATLSVVLPPVPTTVNASSGRTVQIFVSTPPAAIGNAVVTHWRGGIRTDLEVATQPVSGGTLLTTRAVCNAGSIVMIESAALVGSAVLDGTCAEPVRLLLAERATLTATVNAPRGLRAPRWMLLHFQACGSREPMYVAAAIAGSRIRTAAPAGCGAMSLQVSGFAMTKRELQALTSGETRNLGTIALLEGAAAALHVRSESDSEPLSGVRITAIRAADLAAMRNDLRVEPLAMGTAITNASGWAGLSGLPEDRIVFVMQQEGRRYPQVSEPYKLRSGEETVIDDLIVETPANVHVTFSISPEIEGAFELHDVELFATGHTHWPARVPIRAKVTSSGAVVVEDVPPGKWAVRAAGRLKNGFAVRAAEAAIEVVPGVDQHVTLAFNDTLYRGRVTRGGLAVSGTINLAPVDHGVRRRTAVARLGEDGEFQVLLEGEGKYGVSVQDATKRTVRLSSPVDFGDPAGEIKIELPTGQIHGRVVDSAGAPVAEGGVSGEEQNVDPAGAAGARLAPDGRFVLEGVTSGSWRLVAESRNARSETVTIAVGEEDVEGVTLVVDEINSVKVQVRDASGAPLRNAIVDAEYLAPGAIEPTWYGRRTRDAGEVEFRLSPREQATPTNLVIRAPDGPLTCAIRVLDHDEVVSVAPASGELRLMSRAWNTGPGHRKWLISSTGCAVPFYATLMRESVGQEALVFSRLAAGTWSYVVTRTREELQAVLTGRGAGLVPIANFTVRNGRTTRVVLAPQ